MILAGFQTWFDRILDHLGMLEGDVRTVAVSFVIAFAVRQALVLILAIVLAWRFFATGGRRLLDICRTGCVIGRPATDALAGKRTSCQEELVDDSPRHIDSTTSRYSLICRIGNGDVCDVHYGLARQKCDSAVGQVCNQPLST